MEAQLNEKQSLEIITNMIRKTRHRLSESAFDYLMWGWLVFIAAVLQFILLKIPGLEAYAWYTWPVFMTGGGIASGIYNSRKAKEKGHETHIDYMMKYIWGGFIVLMFILLLHAPKIGWTGTQTLIMAMYGLGTFISGALLRFRPMIFGSISAWALAVTGYLFPFFSENIAHTVLLLAASIVTAYLIPGYLLKRSPDYV